MYLVTFKNFTFKNIIFTNKNLINIETIPSLLNLAIAIFCLLDIAF